MYIHTRKVTFPQGKEILSGNHNIIRYIFGLMLVSQQTQHSDRNRTAFSKKKYRKLML